MRETIRGRMLHIRSEGDEEGIPKVGGKRAEALVS